MFDIHHTVAFKILDHFKASKCVEAPKKKGRPKVNYKTNPAFYYIKEELGRQIHSFHANKQHFTLHDLHKYAVEECEFICSMSKLYKIMKSMGYCYRKFNNRKVLIEQPHVITKRIRFIRRYLQYLESNNYIFVFLDETWIHENGNKVRMWINESDPNGVPKLVNGEGKRFTFLHAGIVAGFLPECDLLLSSDLEHRDYHKNMNAEIFTAWVKNQLLPALALLPKPCPLSLGASQ
nr:PREDICTED: uncharacterized protein LOC107398254 isoform X1 [Tribolium castaneum]|eukprot:XP_015837232.1 PREDICTED: uncharacterized protein LOC107398254 isoform X1 [Tribolium castaneum]